MRKNLLHRMVHAGLVLALFPVSAQAIDWLPEKGHRQFTLAGTGAGDQEFDNVTLGGTATFGWFISQRGLIDIRQTVTYDKADPEGSRWIGSTRGAYDYHFGSGGTRFFIGASIGGTYGDGVENTGIAGPELGVKGFVNETTFVYGLVEYQVFFSSSDELEDFKDGSYVFTFGMGIFF